VNISLDTLDRDKYRAITRLGEIDGVLSAIHKCIQLSMQPVKINTVLMNGFNDNEISDFIQLAKDTPLEVRFIELMPIGEGTGLYESRKLGIERILEEHPELIPIQTAKGNTARMYEIKNGIGKIGLITPMSCKFCKDCNRIRLTASGTIKPCLHSSEEVDLKPYLNREDLLLAALADAIYRKPLEHHMDEQSFSQSEKPMYQIGG
jgi:cyclic pyranopterin phosphate synthase